MSGSTLFPYVPHHRQSLLDIAYIVIEHVDDGKMLSETWEEHRFDFARRANLFSGLSRIMLPLARQPLPRIGFWTLDDQGTLSLSNRPFTLAINQQENRQIPTDMPRCLTYSSVEPYYLDLIACQDNHLRHQPNSIHDEEDGNVMYSWQP